MIARAVAAVLLAASAARAAPLPPAPAAPSPRAAPPPRAGVEGAVGLADDPVLARLVAESVAARPELAQAEAAARAERERVPQAGALPDPVLSLGIQNDGFGAIRVGEMETSYYQVMLSQGLPWPGKRGLREDVARLEAERAGAAIGRARLTVEADVRRAYLALLLARDRLALLARLEVLWEKAAGIARVRYEAGEGAQSDVLRAQLEQSRLRQRRWGLEADARAAVLALDRLRGRPLDAPVETSATVRDLGAPDVPDAAAALADALARSPELAEARLGAARAGRQVALSRRERFPDLTLTAGVMPRGKLDPMWLATVGIGLPVWSGRKQARAVSESVARAEAEDRGAQAVEEVLRLRVAERRSALAALADTLRLYREGLLVQSQATVDSTLAQYRVGKVTFASVLEAAAGYVADEEGFLGTVADAQRIAIAAGEVSLDPVGAAGGGGGGGGGMPGAGAAVGAGGGPAGGAAAGAAPGAPAAGAGPASGMSSSM